MAEILVESYESTAFAEGAITITKPTGLEVGDLMFLALTFSTSNTVSTPSGWTVDVNSSTTWGGIGIDLATFYKVADSGDVAASNFSFDVADTSGDLSGCIMRISGFNTDNNFGSTDIGSDASTGTSRSHTVSLTPDQADSILIAVMGVDIDGTASGASSTGSPTWTEVADHNRTSTADSYWMGYAPYPSVTEVTDFSITASGSVSRSDVYMVEIRSQVNGVGTVALQSIAPVQHAPAASAGVSGTVGAQEVAPVQHSVNGVGYQPTVWTPTTKS